MIATGHGNEKSSASSGQRLLKQHVWTKSISHSPCLSEGHLLNAAGWVATLRGRSYDVKPIFGLPHLFELTPSVPLCVAEIRAAVSIVLLTITFSNSDICFCVARHCTLVVGVMLLFYFE